MPTRVELERQVRQLTAENEQLRKKVQTKQTEARLSELTLAQLDTMIDEFGSSPMAVEVHRGPARKAFKSLLDAHQAYFPGGFYYDLPIVVIPVDQGEPVRIGEYTPTRQEAINHARST